MKHKQCNKLILAVLSILVFGFVFAKCEPAKASSLQISAEYDGFTYTNSLEVKLTVNSTSELTMFKYANVRIAGFIFRTQWFDGSIRLCDCDERAHVYFGM